MTTSQRKNSKPKDTQKETTTDEQNVHKFNLKPAIVLMSLAGCYSPQHPDRNIQSTILWVYKATLASIIFLYVLRTVTLLSEPILILSAMTSIIISVQSLGNMFITWKKFSTKYGHFNKATNKLHDVLSVIASNDINVNMKYFTKRRNLIVGFALVTILSGALVHVVMNFVLIPLPGDFKDEFGNHTDLLANSYSKPFDDILVTRIIMFFGLILQLPPFIFPTFFLMCVSVAFLTVFKALNKRIEEMLSLDVEELFSKFESVRKIHADLCSTVQTMDKDLGLLFGNIIFWTISEAILVLYIVVKYTMPTVVQFTMAYYLTMAFLMLAAASILAAMVHEAAHSPLDFIYTINMKEEISLGKVTQLSLFLSRLTGAQVGFTTFGLLTITKEFVLTLAGAFLTYFTVLYTL